MKEMLTKVLKHRWTICIGLSNKIRSSTALLSIPCGESDRLVKQVQLLLEEQVFVYVLHYA